MTDFIQVTDTFYVSPQISSSDLKRAAEDGFSVIIMNRPDGETPDQPPLSMLMDCASKEGLSFQHIPITAPPGPADVNATQNALKEAAGKKVLAFCRSGTRSVTLWVYAQVADGNMTIDDALSAARKAGYDLSGHRGTLRRMVP